jgi:hypothetical protein
MVDLVEVVLVRDLAQNRVALVDHMEMMVELEVVTALVMVAVAAVVQVVLVLMENLQEMAMVE